MNVAGKKFYVSVDLEGMACVVGNYGQGLGDGKNYAFACAQGSREAAAAAGALLDCGAAGVTVWDCHGTGVNLDYNLFDKRCEFMLGAGSRLRFPGIEEGYAGVFFSAITRMMRLPLHLRTCIPPRPFRASGSTANRWRASNRRGCRREARCAGAVRRRRRRLHFTGQGNLSVGGDGRDQKGAGLE